MNPGGKNAQFYFANLGADVMRCALAAKQGNSDRYNDSFARAQKTLSLLHDAGRPEAYEVRTASLARA